MDSWNPMVRKARYKSDLFNAAVYEYHDEDTEKQGYAY